MVHVTMHSALHRSVSFLTKLILTGGKRPLTLEDLGIPAQQDRASVLYEAYDREWTEEKKRRGNKASIMRTIIRATGSCYFFWTAVLLNVVSVLMNFIPTYLLNLLVSDLEQESSGKLDGDESRPDMKMRWVYTVLMLLAPLIQAVVASVIQMMMARIAVSAKAMSSEAIYRKALRLTSTAKGSTSTGQLVNIMSTDTNVLLQFIQLTNLFVMIPVMVLFIPSYDS